MDEAETAERRALVTLMAKTRRRAPRRFANALDASTPEVAFVLLGLLDQELASTGVRP
jgi:hypothetical protein